MTTRPAITAPPSLPARLEAGPTPQRVPGQVRLGELWSHMRRSTISCILRNQGRSAGAKRRLLRVAVQAHDPGVHHVEVEQHCAEFDDADLGGAVVLLSGCGA